MNEGNVSSRRWLTTNANPFTAGNSSTEGVQGVIWEEKGERYKLYRGGCNRTLFLLTSMLPKAYEHSSADTSNDVLFHQLWG